MNQYDIPKPWRYNTKWLIWPNTVLDIMDISDCNDTINGICLQGKTVKQCIEECVGGCDAGYHIQFENGKTVCVPILTNTHPNLNPSYRLRKQSIYPELGNAIVSTFINTDIFPFPPDMANVVFYHDILSLAETKNNTTLGSINIDITDNGLLYMTKEAGNNIQLIPSQESVSRIEKYIPILFGDSIQISVPNTSLRVGLSTEYSDTLEWQVSNGLFYKNDMSFRLMPVKSNKKIGDIITYSDIFSIQYSDNSIVVVDPEYKYLRVKYTTESDISSDYISTFSLISKMTGYYCDNKKCKSVPIKDIQTNGHTGRYNNVLVGRNPDCWGICNNSLINLSDKPPPYTPSTVIVISTVSISFLLIVVIVIIRLFR